MINAAETDTLTNIASVTISTDTVSHSISDDKAKVPTTDNQFETAVHQVLDTETLEKNPILISAVYPGQFHKRRKFTAFPPLRSDQILIRSEMTKAFHVADFPETTQNRHLTHWAKNLVMTILSMYAELIPIKRVSSFPKLTNMLKFRFKSKSRAECKNPVESDHNFYRKTRGSRFRLRVEGRYKGCPLCRKFFSFIYFPILLLQLLFCCDYV